MINILQKDEKLLREIAKPVSKKDFNSAKLKKVLADMSQAMIEQDDAVAIAAPQIGISLRIFIICGRIFDEDWKRGKALPKDYVAKHKDLIFINPEIIKISGDKKSVPEACLSVRYLVGKTKRATKTTIKAFNENGDEFIYNATALMAQIFQHETEHLNGILFIDHAKHIKDEEEKWKKEHPTN